MVFTKLTQKLNKKTTNDKLQVYPERGSLSKLLGSVECLLG